MPSRRLPQWIALASASFVAAPASAWQTHQIISSPRPDKIDHFGISVAVLRFNHDGHPDIAVGATGKGGANPTIGRAYVFLGPNYSSYELLISSESDEGDQFGSSLAAGDLDGDGWDELAVGASSGELGSGPENAGYASVWEWQTSPERPHERCVFGSSSPEMGSAFGVSVSIATLGPPIVIVGEYHRRHPQTSVVCGAVNLFSCPQGQPAQDLGTIFNPDPLTEGSFGTRLAIGDWNRDFVADLYVSAMGNSVVTEGDIVVLQAGQVFVYHGPLVAGVAPSATIDNPTPLSDEGATAACAEQRFGMWLSGGDLNGDGYGELAIGAARKDRTVGATQICDAGVGFIVSGRDYDPGEYVELLHPTPAVKDYTGYRVQIDDFLNGPYADVAVCDLVQSMANPEEAMLWFGADLVGSTSAGPPDDSVVALATSESHWCDGMASGDLDSGQGYHDLVAGDRDFPTTSGAKGGGRVVVYYIH